MKTSARSSEAAALEHALGGLALPRRFGADCIALAALDGLAASVGHEDRGWSALAEPPEVRPGRITLRFAGMAGGAREEAVLAAPSDALASAIVGVEVRGGDATGPRVALEVDPRQLDHVVGVLRGARHALALLGGLRPGGVLHLQTAQRLGHTVRMLRLHEVWRAGRAPSLLFVVPSPANVTLCRAALDDGTALLWRQLVEPGYGRSATPLDPLGEGYAHSLALAVAANRHVLAIAIAAVGAGVELSWVNDARHEGPLLFRAAIDHCARVRPRGRLRVVQLAYGALDPAEAIPERLAREASEAAAAMRQRASAAGGVLPDGRRLARHHLVAQAQLAARAAPLGGAVEVRTLYMSSYPAEALSHEGFDDAARDWLRRHPPELIPEIAASRVPEGEAPRSARRHLRRVALSVGLSGHPRIEALVTLVRSAAIAHPDVHITLVGRGTDVDPGGGPPPNNLALMGVVDATTHDAILAAADVVGLKTTRNMRAYLLASRARGQGVLLLPRPLEAPLECEAHTLAYLGETLDEHVGDLALTQRWLTDAGSDEPSRHELDLGRPLVPQAQAALAAWTPREASTLRLGSPEELAAWVDPSRAPTR